jgi:hypothetical protein
MEDDMTLKKRGLKLLQEPSTYAGLAAFLGGSAILGLDVDGWIQVFAAVAAVAGAVAMFVLDPADEGGNHED